MPSVSVVIPVHNRVSFIQGAIRTAVGQTTPPDEIVVVDDGSTDGTAERLRTVGLPNLKVVTLPTNRGASAARNAGLEAASGDVVAFLDSDDEWWGWRLENQVPADPGPGLYVSAFDVHTRGGRVRGTPGCSRGDAHRRLLRLQGGPLTASCMMVDRRVCDLRFDESLPVLEDLDFAIRASVHGVGYNSLPLALKRSLDDRLYTTAGEVPARLRLLEIHADALATDPVALGSHHLAIARAAAAQGEDGLVVAHLDLAAAAWWPARAARVVWRRQGHRGLRAFCRAWWFLNEAPVAKIRSFRLSPA